MAGSKMAATKNLCDAQCLQCSDCWICSQVSWTVTEHQNICLSFTRNKFSQSHFELLKEKLFLKQFLAQKINRL